jgi:hypothetical protein
MGRSLYHEPGNVAAAQRRGELPRRAHAMATVHGFRPKVTESATADCSTSLLDGPRSSLPCGMPRVCLQYRFAPIRIQALGTVCGWWTWQPASS